MVIFILPHAVELIHGFETITECVYILERDGFSKTFVIWKLFKKNKMLLIYFANHVCIGLHERLVSDLKTNQHNSSDWGGIAKHHAIYFIIITFCVDTYLHTSYLLKIC